MKGLESWVVLTHQAGEEEEEDVCKLFSLGLQFLSWQSHAGRRVLMNERLYDAVDTAAAGSQGLLSG